MSDGLSGKTLGRYQVLERLGRGGMAEVFRAYQPSLERYVAIKVIYPHLAGDSGLRERFGREARAVAALRHPNIVQVYDFDVAGDMAFMAMEFIGGPTLKAAIQSLGRRGRLLPLPVVGQIIGQLADALAYAHAQQVVHRDVKPANVLLRHRAAPDGPLDDKAIDALLLNLGPDSVVLTDFGVARVLGDSSEQTAAGTILGSPAYMAPEQGRGERADARSDIYALGVVLYELLTGQVPFDADTPFAIVVKHNQSPLPPPRTLRPDLSEGLERVLLKALAKLPAERFQDAAAFGSAVREQTAGGSLTGELTLAPPRRDAQVDEATAAVATRYIDELHVTRLAGVTPPAQARPAPSRPATPAPEARAATARPPRKRGWLRRTLGCLATLTVVAVLMVIAFAAGGLAVFSGLGKAGALTVPTELVPDVTAAAANGEIIPFLDPERRTPLPPPVTRALAEALSACRGEGCPGGSARGAVAILDAAIAEHPDNAALYAARAQAYVWWDPAQYADQIEDDVAAALDHDPNSVAAYLARARMHRSLGKLDEARADYEEALKLTDSTSMRSVMEREMQQLSPGGHP